MNFQNLEEYYNYLETDTDFSYLDLNTYKYITALRDKTEDVNLKKICSYELFFAEFKIEKGVQIPKYKIDGNSYPTLELFDDNFEYIKIRAKNANNPKYKAKYNHLLWLSPQKRKEFAETAIDNYFFIFKNLSFSNKDNLLCLSFCKHFENLFILSQTINYKTDEVIQYFVLLLESDKLNDFTKYSLMNFIVAKNKKTELSIMKEFFDYSNEAIKHLEPRDLESYLNLLVILSQKLKLSPNEFHEKLGDLHISQLKTEPNEGIIAHHYYTNALEEYKKAKNKEKIEQTAVLLEQAKKHIDLKKVSVEIEDEKIIKAINQWWEKFKITISELIENNESESIYSYLILEVILPKAETLKEEIRPVAYDLITTMAFDINYNVSKKKSSGIKSYNIHIDNFTIKQIGVVFSKGIKSGKVSFESLIDFLKNNSWYGQDFTYFDTNKETKGFDWIELLSPSLQSFFIQIEIDIKMNKEKSQGYILAIDSLVLKFEGLLREFSRMIGAQTIEIKENGTEERINIEKLLDNEKLKALIPDDDIAYFKYLFTSEGMNLRNNIAHSFYRTNNYTSAIMLLLIVALLKLGNFKLETTEKDT